MGNWHISIQGLGSHHNDREQDANEMASEFVKALEKAGHNVGDATFTYGGADNLHWYDARLPKESK